MDLQLIYDQNKKIINQNSLIIKLLSGKGKTVEVVDKATKARNKTVNKLKAEAGL